MEKILVLNLGSSSIKYKLYLAPTKKSLRLISSGQIEKIKTQDGIFTAILYPQIEQSPDRIKGTIRKITLDVANHQQALTILFTFLIEQDNALLDKKDEDSIIIGHRVVHGGNIFSEPTSIDDAFLEKIKSIEYLAPLHNPVNVEGILVARSFFPKSRQIAVFDTAFHATIPSHASYPPLPNALVEKYNIKKYGFHGISHEYLTHQAGVYLNKPSPSIISFHLGNGASLAAVRDGKCIDTSMGMTPLAGLMMGTRSGDLDPGILLYLQKQVGLSVDEIDTLLNKKSGLLGVSGSNDLRDVIRQADELGDKQARLALDMFCYRLRFYLGAYLLLLKKIDALIFSAGIGENSAFIRKRCCDDLLDFGVEIDDEKNEKLVSDDFSQGNDATIAIQSSRSKVSVLVIRTDEEWQIAKKSFELINK